MAAFTLDPFLRVEADVVLAEAEPVAGDEDIEASAFVAEVTAGLQAETGRAIFRIEAQAERVEFEDPDFTDRWRYFGRVEVEQDLGQGWELRLRAERSIRFPSAEYFDVDETEFRARLRYEPVREHRLGLAFRWRERDYRDSSGASGSGPRLEGEYRYRFGRYHYLAVDARYEDISSTDAGREYQRRAVSVSYTKPLAADLRIRPKLAYRVTDFPGRLAGAGQYRKDHQFTPEIELLWWPGSWRNSAEIQYRHRTSTDNDRELSGLRFQLKLAHVF